MQRNEKGLPCPKKKGCLKYDTLLHLMVRLQFWISGECGVPLDCHYSQVPSVTEW